MSTGRQQRNVGHAQEQVAQLRQQRQAVRANGRVVGQDHHRIEVMIDRLAQARETLEQADIVALPDQRLAIGLRLLQRGGEFAFGAGFE